MQRPKLRPSPKGLPLGMLPVLRCTAHRETQFARVSAFLMLTPDEYNHPVNRRCSPRVMNFHWTPPLRVEGVDCSGVEILQQLSCFMEAERGGQTTSLQSGLREHGRRGPATWRGGYAALVRDFWVRKAKKTHHFLEAPRLWRVKGNHKEKGQEQMGHDIVWQEPPFLWWF